MKSSGWFQCWYVLFGGEIPQHMQVFCTKMLLKEEKKKKSHTDHGAVLNYRFVLYLRFCSWTIQ